MSDMTAEERGRKLAMIAALYFDSADDDEFLENFAKDAMIQLQTAAAQARAEEREACAVLAEVSPDGIRCPFDDPNCKVEFEELCPICGQDNNAEGGKQCGGSTYRVSTAAAIRARSD